MFAIIAIVLAVVAIASGTPVSQPLNMSVNNFVDWDTGVPDAMATPAGTKVIMNIIRREKTKINAMLGRL